MRSAINDLQAIALGNDKLTVEDVKQQASRDDRQDIFDALKIVFKTSTAITANQATQNLDEDADTFLQWIRENTPREYERSEDLARAYYWISEADLFNGRIRKRMNWKLMKYVFQFSTVGVALAKDEKYSGWTKYQYPSKIRRMGSSRGARDKLDSIGSKMGEKLHMSKKDVKSDLPMFADFLDNYPELQRQMGLEDDEIEFIRDFGN